MRAVFIDASMSMSGTPYETAVEHAKAFETPETVAYVVYAFGDLDETTVGQLQPYKVNAARMSGPDGLQATLERVLFKDDAVIPIVYTHAEEVPQLAETLGGRAGEIRAYGGDQKALEAIAAQMGGQPVLPIPDMSLWERTDVPTIVKTLTYVIEEAKGRIEAFREQMDRNIVHALEHSEGAMRACALEQAATTALNLLRTIGTRTIGGGQSRPVDFAMIREMQRGALACAVAAVSSSSSSPTANLMRQAQLQAAWRIGEIIDTGR